MKRTIIQVSEEQLEYLLDNMPPPSNDDPSWIPSLRERLTESLNDCRNEQGGSSVSDFS